MVLESVISQSLRYDLLSRLRAIPLGVEEIYIDHLTNACAMIEDYKAAITSLPLFQTMSESKLRIYQQLETILNPLLDGVAVILVTHT